MVALQLAALSVKISVQSEQYGRLLWTLFTLLSLDS